MDSLIELIIGLIVVVFSVLWDKAKKTPSSVENDEIPTELSAIEDFFKKLNEGQPSGPAPSSENSPTQAKEWPDWEKASIESPPPPPPPPPPPEIGQIPMERSPEKIKKKKAKPKPPPPKEHVPTVNPLVLENLDKLPSLEARKEVERLIPSSNQVSVAKTALPLPAKKGWSKSRILDAVIMSEILTRYDFNRVFARIPGKKRED